MGRGQEQKPTLALALDDSTRSALQAVAKVIEACPDEWLGIEDATFEPETHERFQMAFVLCTDGLCRLPSECLQTLHDDIQRHVAAASVEGFQALHCRGLELFGPDNSHLIARFRVPPQLTQLRRAVWRTCKDFRIAFPDAIWAPHIRLGRIKASRAQLNKVALSKLPEQLSELAIQPKALTLLGKQPQDSYCDCNWNISLLASMKQLEVKEAALTTTFAAEADTAGKATPEEPAGQVENSSERATSAPSVASRSGGFVAELPKLRRPVGDPGCGRPVRKGSVIIAPP